MIPEMDPYTKALTFLGAGLALFFVAVGVVLLGRGLAGLACDWQEKRRTAKRLARINNIKPLKSRPPDEEPISWF